MQSLEFIDSYFKGTLTPEETGKFEHRILHDPDFAAEVAFYFNAQQELETKVREEKKQRFLALYRESAVPAAKPAIVRRMFTPLRAAAAALIPVIAATWYFLMMPVSVVRLADNYIDKDLKQMNVRMSSTVDHQQKGIMAYNGGLYQEALKEFELAIQSDPSSPEAKKLAGIVSLRLEEYDKALSYFKQVDNIPNQYSNPGKFYQALTLMKRNRPGDRQEAKQLLDEIVAKKLEGNETAQRWLDSW